MRLTRTMLIVTSLLVVIAIALFVSQNASENASGNIVATQREEISFGYVPSAFNALPIIALRKGFFTEEGLNVREERTSFVGYIFPELAGGRLDFISGGETPGMFAALKGGNFSIIAQEVESNDLSLLARRDAGINSFNDLAGKRAGISKNSVAQYNLWLEVRKNGMSPFAVNVVDLQPQNMASALDRGDVDAVYVWEPVATKIAKGLPQTKFVGEKGKWFVLLYASEKTSPAKKLKALNALHKAQKFIAENPEEAKNIVAKEIGLDDETLQQTWGYWKFELKPFENIGLLEKEASWAIENGAPSGKPNFSSYVDSTALKEVLALRAT